MNPKRVRQLQVQTPQGISGTLTKEARLVFNYETTDRAAEASIVLPIRAQSYSKGDLFSIFAMNRPEGYLLEYIKERFSKSLYLDEMMLLKLTGSHQIGRLSYRDLADDDEVRIAPQVTAQEIIGSNTSEELFEFLVDLYFSSGISGFQPKVIVPVIDKKTVATAEYIVKSSGEDYPFLAQNEFMCMSVARTAGIQVPPFWLSADGGLFMMERFDRTADGQKFGLEDMVVLMGKTANEKYHGSYESIAKAIDLYCGEHAAESKARFFEYLAVSALLKNGDAHLKNFSLLYDVPTGAIKLSPLYDVVSTIIYEIVNPKTGATRVDNSMALQMFKQKSFPVNAELIQFGKSVCMVNNPQDVIERIEEAKHVVMRKHANEMDPSLITKLKMAWRI